MDKDEIIQLLRSNVEEFNRRRQKEPDFNAAIDLKGADLSGATLTKADLGRLDLSGANLRGADLRETMLTNTKLEGADLRDVNLTDANMHRIRIGSANMQGANTEDFAGGCRICMHATNFQSVHWGKEQLEAMLQVINQNADWEVKYEIVAKNA